LNKKGSVEETNWNTITKRFANYHRKVWFDNRSFWIVSLGEQFER